MRFNPSVGVGGKRTGKKPVPGPGIEAIDSFEMYFQDVFSIFNEIMGKFYSVFPSGITKTEETDPIRALSECYEQLKRIVSASMYIERLKQKIKQAIMEQLTERAAKHGTYDNKALTVAFGKVYYIKAYASNMMDAVGEILEVMTEPKSSKKELGKYKTKFTRNVDLLAGLLNPDDNEEIIRALRVNLKKQIPWQRKETKKQEVEDDTEDEDDEDDDEENEDKDNDDDDW